MTNVPGADARPSAYDDCIADAVAHSGALMQRVLDRARDGLSQLQAGLQGVRASAVPEALHLLGRHAEFLAARFPEALREAITGVSGASDHASPGLGELSLANDGEVDDRIELTRSRQTTLRAVAAPLSEFAGLVCAAQGLPTGQADTNPLGPEVYIRALKELVDRTDAAKVARALWMQHLSAALGPELAAEYLRLSAMLRAAGIEPVGHAAVPASPHTAVTVAEASSIGEPEPVRPADPNDQVAAARRIAAEIAAWPEFDRVPPAVRDFVCGPWSEVIAKARANAGAGPTDPGGAYAMVRPLFWSAQPELGRSDVQRLMIMVPSLLSRLRTGLQTIDYPADKTESFFKALNELHGIAARAPGSSFALRKSARDEGQKTASPGATESVPDHTLAVSASALEVLSLGVWVESFAGRHWQRMQLTWVSPKRALMLFTAEDGSTESMSRRGCLRRMRDGQLRIVPDLDLDSAFG